MIEPRVSSRRAVLGGICALLLTSGGARAGRRRAARIVVDTSPLAARGQGELGRNIRPELEGALADALAHSAAGAAGASVVLRVDAVTMAMYGGTTDTFLGPNDTADAVLIVRLPSGATQAFPISVSQPAWGGGPAVDPNSEVRRVQALVNAIAYWAARRIAELG